MNSFFKEQTDSDKGREISSGVVERASGFIEVLFLVLEHNHVKRIDYDWYVS